MQRTGKNHSLPVEEKSDAVIADPRAIGIPEAAKLPLSGDLLKRFEPFDVVESEPVNAKVG
jgi:hypothetical protein